MRACGCRSRSFLYGWFSDGGEGGKVKESRISYVMYMKIEQGVLYDMKPGLT